MKLIIRMIILCVLLLVMSSCGLNHEQSQSAQPDDSGNIPDSSIPSNQEPQDRNQPGSQDTPEVELPLDIKLDFNPVELQELNEESPKQSMVLMKSHGFGEVKGDKVILHIYEDKNVESYCREAAAYLEYNGKTYALSDCAAYSLLTDNPEEIGAVQVTEYQFSDTDDRNGLFLLGGVELLANGPGRMAYILYDESSQRWLTFEAWGKLQLHDLDEDGTVELFNQFEGHHLHTPDVNFYRWNNGQLEGSKQLKAILQITDYQPSYVMNIERDQRVLFQVEINTIEDSDIKPLATAIYRYEQGSLLRVE